MLPTTQTAVAQWRPTIPLPRWDDVSQEILKLVKYALVGLSTSIVSMTVLNLFFFFLNPTTPLILILGSTTAYAAGDINSYWWNWSWTFRAGKPSWRQFARFAALSILGMAINAAVLWGSAGWLLTLLLPAWLVSNVPQVSMTLSGSLGYLACRLWVFKS